MLGVLIAVTFVAWVAGPAEAQQHENTGKGGAPMVRGPRGGLTMGVNRRWLE